MALTAKEIAVKLEQIAFYKLNHLAFARDLSQVNFLIEQLNPHHQIILPVPQCDRLKRQHDINHFRAKVFGFDRSDARVREATSRGDENVLFFFRLFPLAEAKIDKQN
jgi:hypothetical protein